MDRTRPHDHQQAVIGTMQDAVNVLTGFERRIRGFFTQRKFTQQMSGRRKFLDFLYPQIISTVQHHNP
jgi:hypothetical protein